MKDRVELIAWPLHRKRWLPLPRIREFERLGAEEKDFLLKQGYVEEDARLLAHLVLTRAIERAKVMDAEEDARDAWKTKAVKKPKVEAHA
jgi:hypothetical protein